MKFFGLCLVAVSLAASAQTRPTADDVQLAHQLLAAFDRMNVARHEWLVASNEAWRLYDEATRNGLRTDLKEPTHCEHPYNPETRKNDMPFAGPYQSFACDYELSRVRVSFTVDVP